VRNIVLRNGPANDIRNTGMPPGAVSADMTERSEGTLWWRLGATRGRMRSLVVGPDWIQTLAGRETAQAAPMSDGATRHRHWADL